MPKAVVLINVGSPAAPTPPAVKRYLDEFLMDPHVIDLPAWLRYPLVRWWITPRRSRSSARLYQKIWSSGDSPLIEHSMACSHAVAEQLGQEYTVRAAMRYGAPALIDVLRDLGEGHDELIAVPLYPQFSLAATQSAIDAAMAHWAPRSIRVAPPFYSHPGFIDAFAALARRALENFAFDKVLFSFHGLPRRHLTKLHPHCLSSPECCAVIGPHNDRCYRAQAFHSAFAIAKRLGLGPGQFEVTFQSRLTSRWITPFTDVRYRELPAEGIKRLAVICPSFVVDCLETIEEVQIRGERLFREQGGSELKLVPSLNANPRWISALCEMILKDSSRPDRN